MNGLEIIGQVQSNGGLLFLAVLAVLELRQTRKDFEKHKHDSKTGKPFIEV